MRPPARWCRGIVCLLLGIATPPGANAQEPGADSRSCVDYANGLKAKVEANYAGFVLEVVGDRRAEYDRHARLFLDQAAATPPDQCFRTLRDFTAWFADPHLFVFQSTRIDSIVSDPRARPVERRAASESDVRADLLRRAARLDPIEGIWTDGRFRVAVIPVGEARFEAVVVTPDTLGWSVGDVRATITADRAGYAITLLHRNRAVRVLDGTIHKRRLLRIPPEMWAREYPVQPEDEGLVDLSDPRGPTLLVRDGTVIVSLPSHSPAYKPVLDSLLARNADVLRRSERLIVDLRGNEGGSSFMSNGLLPYVLSADELPARYPERGGAVMLSSPDQIAYARQAFGPDTSVFVRRLLDRLRARPGALVPLTDGEDDVPAQRPLPITGPARVGIMIDGGTVSAAEVLVLKALRSTRAIVFGRPTGGALDYQSTNIVPIVPGRGRWYLGYPTIARDTLLPLDGMRGRGIAPDVVLEWERLADPIGAVDQQLRQGRQREAPDRDPSA